jgi:hypothetical protein
MSELALECGVNEFWPAPPCGWHGACINGTVCVCDEGWSTVFPVNGAQICFRDLNYMTFMFAARLVLGLLKISILLREIFRVKDRTKRLAKSYRLFWMLESEATGAIVSVVSVADPALQPFYNRIVTALDFSCVMGVEMDSIMALDKFIRYINRDGVKQAPRLERGFTGITLHTATRRVLRVQMALSLFSALVFLLPMSWVDAMRVSFAAKIASLVAAHFRDSSVLDPVLNEMCKLHDALQSGAGSLGDHRKEVIDRVSFKLELGQRRRRVLWISRVIFTFLSLLYMIWPFWMVTVLYNPSFFVFVLQPVFLLDSYKRIRRERRNQVDPVSQGADETTTSIDS